MNLMKDQLLKALAYQDQIRIIVVSATQCVEEAHRRHDTWHTATAALGRTLIASRLMAANLKGEDQISVRLQGTGPGGLIQVQADSHGNVRGYISQPHIALELNDQGKLDVSGAVGLPGTLSVQKYIADTQPFTGQVALVSGEIAEDFTYYMAISEQTPSAFGLSVVVNPDESVKSAGGFMIQVLPDAQEETLSALEAKLASFGSLSKVIEEAEDLEALLAFLVGEDNYRIISQDPVTFFCPCHKERFGDLLQALSIQELEDMVNEDNGAEVVCHYCNETYDFTEEELKDLIEDKRVKEGGQDV